jgi:hypothetical protein
MQFTLCEYRHGFLLMHFEYKFPSPVAVMLASSVGLTDSRCWPSRNDDMRMGAYFGPMYHSLRSEYTTEEREAIEMVASYQFMRLATFQKVAAVLPFEKAMLIYKGEELTEEQLNILKLIAEITPGYLKADIAEQLVHMLPRDVKSAAAIATALMAAINGGDFGDEASKKKLTKQAEGIVKSFYMEMTSE